MREHLKIEGHENFLKTVIPAQAGIHARDTSVSMDPGFRRDDDRRRWNNDKSKACPAFQQKSWVVFSGQTDVPWLKVLRPGFRHCFVLLHDGRCWLSVDPMLNYMDVQVHHVSPDFDLPHWLESRGHVVVPAHTDRNRRKPAPWRPFTCVEAVKRVLGIHARRIMTPWQLYRHLTTQQGEFSWEA